MQNLMSAPTTQKPSSRPGNQLVDPVGLARGRAVLLWSYRLGARCLVAWSLEVPFRDGSMQPSGNDCGALDAESTTARNQGGPCPWCFPSTPRSANSIVPATLPPLRHPRAVDVRLGMQCEHALSTVGRRGAAT